VGLRLGTFNVWGLPKPFGDDLSARTRAIVRRLPDLDLDVLLLQETWTDEIRDALHRAGEQAGFDVALASRESGGGLMVMSRLPVVHNRFEKYHFRGDPERFALGEFIGAKGFQSLVLRGEHGPVHLINTHLHARYREQRPRLNSAVRTAQLLQLVGEIHRLEGTVLVGGDFNCTETDPEYRIFKGLTGSVEVAEGRRDLPTITRSNYYKRHRSGHDKRIDYLFHRAAPQTRTLHRNARLLFAEREEIRGISRSLSDHYGISADIDWVSAEASGLAHGRLSVDPAAADLARSLLDLGSLEADRREGVHFRYAGACAAGAVLAAGLQRAPALDRRRFLRGTLGALALASCGSAGAFTTLARFDSDSKRDAFADARDILRRLETDPREVV
jgi:endonuclease/exonuclease/phosphatase family metal-dependent hydrolase